MKKFIVGLMLIASSAFAQEVVLPDFGNWKMTDISTRGYKKDVLFNKMNRDMIKLGESICSNRALVWAYDFKRFQNLDVGKVFLFYTKKTGDVGQKTWWYHVSPVVNEKGVIYALDAGFPGSINSALTTKDWLKRFTGSSNCKEIQSTETDLIERMFDGYVFPQETSYGNHDCYYKYAPGGYWTPASVAKGLLGKDENGKPISYVRDEIDTAEVYSACVEAVTTGAGRFFGGGKKKCKEYLGL